ncbi:hypothetical protein J4230_02715 [Candidatus Woesearchaeota archaeon]|nr:hypothetical protein [Candidatus Woesearchaeota archaeon]
MEINKNLIKFTKEMILFCKSHGVTPIICGSYLTKYYTQDERIVVHDVDMYVPDAFLPKAIKLLEKKKIKYKHLKEWGCLKVYKGNVNIDLDALNFLYKGPKDFRDLDFEGIKLKALSPKGLLFIYKVGVKACQTSWERRQHTRKVRLLEKYINSKN